MNVFKKVNGYETANKSLFPLIVKIQSFKMFLFSSIHALFKFKVDCCQFSERCQAFFPKKDSRKRFRKYSHPKQKKTNASLVSL